MLKLMSRIDATIIVFDQGNTLIMDPFEDVLSLKKERFRMILSKHGIRINSKKILEAWRESNRQVTYPFIAHFFQEEPIVFDFLRRIDVSDEKASLIAPELLKEYRKGYKQLLRNSRRIKRIKSMLRKLKKKGKRLGIFSNDRKIALASMLKWTLLEKYFEYAVSSEELGFEKPDARFFKEITRKFNAPPEKIVYVGDDMLRDIYPAKKNGLNAIWYKVDTKKYNMPWRRYDVKIKCKPDAVIKNLNEIEKIVN